MATQRNNSEWDPNHLRRRLQAMDDFDFEHLVADLWSEQGWNTEVEQQSGDAGIDVRATKTEPYPRKALIQAKRYSDDNPVGGPDIQQYSALKQQERDVDEAILVTTGRFTGSAEDRARDLNVKTVDGNGLTNLIDNLNAYSVVEEYIGLPGGGSRTPQSDRSSTTDRHTGSMSRDKLEEVVGQDLDEFLKNERYQATRAMEKAKGKITLNPHDAKKIGVFEDIPNGSELERSFEQNKEKLVVFKDDVHMDGEGEIYIEDVTKYVTETAIKSGQSGPIIGVLQRGVSDGAWMSEKGEALLKHKNQKQWVRTKITDGVSALRSTDDQSPTPTENKSPQTDAVNHQSSRTTRFYGAATGTAGWFLTSIIAGLNIPSAKTKITDAISVLRNTDSQSPTPAEDKSSQTDTVNLQSSRTTWFYGAATGTAGWFLTWVVAGLNAPSAIVGLFIIVSWFILPLSIGIDSRQSGFFSISRTEVIAYIILSLIPVLALFPGVAYIYRREKLFSSNI